MTTATASRSSSAPWRLGCREGKIKFREDVVDGLEQAPEAFIGLLEGRNFGSWWCASRRIEYLTLIRGAGINRVSLFCRTLRP